MPPPAGKLETILVVDDNPSVLRVVVKILEAENFHVISATSGPSALKLAGEHTETIDLLLSDVEMPDMSGPDLGEALKVARPQMHIMLMSGAENGNLLVLNYGWAYIQKPFVAMKLVEMINAVLHTPNRSQPAARNLTCGGIRTSLSLTRIISNRFTRAYPTGRQLPAGKMPKAG
ncbi:MAG: response regulator [Ignavibacteriota bacterium]